MSFRTVIDSILDIAIEKNDRKLAICGLWMMKNSNKRKRNLDPARVRILETSNSSGQDLSRFVLEILWIDQKKKPDVIRLVENVNLIKLKKLKYSLSIVLENIDFEITLAAQSETECQRWTSALLDIFSISSTMSVRKSNPFSLCLSDYFVSIVDTEQAEQCGLVDMDYWAGLEKNTGLTLFPASPRFEWKMTKPITIPFRLIVWVKLMDVENAVDCGKMMEICLHKPLDSVDGVYCEQSMSGEPARMTRRWRQKSPKKVNGEIENGMKSIAALGYHTLALFCADAQKFVTEWKSCHNLHTISKSSNCKPDTDRPGDINGNRLSSSSTGSQSASTTSQSNLSVLNSFLRRSLPSLNNNTAKTSHDQSPSGPNRPPPLPSRKELEQRENERLFERQIRLHWGRLDDWNVEEEEEEKNGHSSNSDGQYKLLSAQPVPVLNSPPPLPPKHDKKRDVVKNDGGQGRVNSVHYKFLPAVTGSVPPLPPRRPEKGNVASATSKGYKTLNSIYDSESNMKTETERYQNGYRIQKKSTATFYDLLPDYTPVAEQKTVKPEDTAIRQSLETEV